MRALDVNAEGLILFQDQKGYEDPLRKHEHSSGTADIWMLDGGKYTQLTFADCQDQNPVWGPDGTFFYTSEEGDGNLNVYRAKPSGKGVQLTHFANHPVRTLSSSDNGTLAFSWNGEIYTMLPTDAEPRKVNVEINTDNLWKIRRHRENGYSAHSLSVSPDGEEVAFVSMGDIYVANVKYGTTKQITATPGQERNVSFSPDGRTLVYDSERDGQWQLFTATIADKKQKHFAYATEITETPLYKADGGKPAFQPAFSPDGKKIAFLEDRTTLRTVNADGKKPVTALEGKYNYSYTDGDVSYRWSPDSHWFLVDYIGNGGWNNPDIALVKADGTEVHDLTQSGYNDSNAKWALGGKAIIWGTDRNGYRSHGSWGSEGDAYIMFLDGEAYDRFLMTEEELSLADATDEGKKEKKDTSDAKPEKVKPLEFDIENAKYRCARLTPGASRLGDFAISPKGDKFYYVSGGDLYMRDLKKGDVKMLRKGYGYGSLDFDSKGENIYAQLDGISKITTSGDISKVKFLAEQDYSITDEFAYIFDHMHRQVTDKFYDPALHGVDWEMYGENYRKFLPHITNTADMAELMSEILGELNASHTGARASMPTADRQTSALGAFFDQAYEGSGLKVSETLKRGPLAMKGSEVHPGDIILAIDGKEITTTTDINSLLDGRQGKRTRLTVKRRNGKTEELTVKPISLGTQSQLLYRRWVERNQAAVDSLSGGRIAYVHVEGMDSPSFRTVFSELLGKYRNHEAVIVDTRYNGGGWLHNDIAQLLSGREYVRFEPRGQYIGSEPFTQWTKPSCMLVNESNYSDAHGTPFVYKTLGIGKLIGAPVPGTMTAVWWENQVNPDLLFGIPQVTTKDMEGNVLENRQLNPDIIIYNTPEDVQRGHDAQLAGAVKHLLEQLK